MNKTGRNYTILHLHTDISNTTTSADSVTKYKDYIKRAKECGMSAIAFSEHGNIFNFVQKKQSVEAAGMKYIHAIEAYVTENKDERVRDNYHCLLIAKNYEGFKELNRLSSASFNREDGHYYYNPRITFDELTHTSDNIIICTACVGSIFGKGSEELQKRYIEFLSQNSDRCFLEMQHHNTEAQKEYNIKMMNLSKEYGVRLVVNTDTHCLNSEHELGRKILQQSKNVFFDDEDGWDLCFRTYEELVEAMQIQGVVPEEIYLEAIENTNVIADMVTPIELDRSFKFPKIYENSESILRSKLFDEKVIQSIVDEGFDREEIISRLEEEMSTFIALDSTDYILLEDYIIQYAHKNDIWQGPARGSAASSLALYALGVTEVNPVKYGFFFWRFMDKDKYSLPD